MLLSLLTSANSIRTGIAEAHELVVAETEHLFADTSFRVIRLNDYYARKAYLDRRSIWVISALRVSEAITITITFAVSAASSTAKDTYTVAATVCFMLTFPFYVHKHGSTIR